MAGLALGTMRRGRSTLDPLRDAFIVAGGVYVAAILTGVVGGGPDGVAYWSARLPDPYRDAAYGSEAGFYYAPVIAQLLAPLTALPWSIFHALIVAADLVALYWMLGRWSIIALVLPPVLIEVYSANINLLIAAAIVAGFRYPAAWVFPVLTKVAPGVGLLWFVVRREWRPLAVVIATTVMIVAMSYLIAPSPWARWVGVLVGNVGIPAPLLALPIPFLLRLPLAIVILGWGAATDRRWTLPVAATLAMPVLWPAQLSILLAAVPLRPAGAFDWLGPRR